MKQLPPEQQFCIEIDIQLELFNKLGFEQRLNAIDDRMGCVLRL